MTHNRELISALADGQLAGEDFAGALAVCQDDHEALASWNSYHLIGDVLRAPELTAHACDTAFVARLRGRLSQEAAPATAAVLAPVVAQPIVIQAVKGSGRGASNDTSFRWKLVAGFASIAAVSAIAWNTGAGLLAPAAAPQLARTESVQPVLVVSEQGTMLRDPRMQELLAAHKQFGGTSALQMPSGFLRNATFESPQSERR
jgi:sigma-E factor negative regulatory protein RseA